MGMFMMEEIKKYVGSVSEYQKKFLRDVDKIITDKSIPIKSKSVRWREDNKGVIVAEHPFTGVVSFMNPTMAIIFKLCDGRNSFKDLKKHMRNKFPDVDQQTLFSDVRKAVISLFINGFINIKTAGKKVSVTDLIKVSLHSYSWKEEK